MIWYMAPNFMVHFGPQGSAVPELARFRASKDHMDIRILQTIISGMPVILGFGTRV